MKRRKIVLALAAVAVSTLLAVGVAAFVLLDAHGRHFHRALTKGRWPVDAYRYSDATGSFEMTPGMSKPMLDGSFHVKTHALGFRIPEDADASDVRRGGLLAIGCSFTFGDGVEAEETFTDVAAGALGLAAYNYGVCSYSYASSIRQLEDLERRGVLAELAPSVLVLGSGSWLPARSRSPFYPTPDLQLAYPYIGLDGERPALLDPPDLISVRHAIGFAASAAYFDGDTRDAPLDLRHELLLLDVIPRVLWARARQRTFSNPVTDEQIYAFTLDRISAVARRIGARLVVVDMPIHVGEASVDPALVAAIDACRCATLVDGRDALQRHGARGARLAHPDRAAHAAYAAALVEAVEHGRAAPPGAVGDRRTAP